MIIRTVCGYDFFEVSSAMQKAIRRADTGVAGFFALELWMSGYKDYVWKRLFTISAEDCFGIITKRDRGAVARARVGKQECCCTKRTNLCQ